MINIVLSSDENYAPYGAVVIASALANTAHAEALNFHWLTYDLSDATENKLRSMVERQRARLSIIRVTPSDLKGLQLGRFGQSSLLRLSMHRYLPSDCRKVIYLDCDLLILEDLANLWELPLKNKPIGAVLDLCGPRQLATRNKFESYFNSGVMLIDLDCWKEEKIGERAIQYLASAGSLSFPDQDSLNHVLADDWERLPLSWNFQPTAYAALEKRYPHLRPVINELGEAAKKPNIVHYIGGCKPWHPMCIHPLKEDFIKYSQLTPWPIDHKNIK